VVRPDHRTQALGDGAAASAGEQLEQFVLDPTLCGRHAIGMEGICRAPQVFDGVTSTADVVLRASAEFTRWRSPKPVHRDHRNRSIAITEIGSSRSVVRPIWP